MQVELTRRWGQHPAGRTVDVDPVQGAWLVQHGYGQAVVVVPAPEAPTGRHAAPDTTKPARRRSKSEA